MADRADDADTARQRPRPVSTDARPAAARPAAARSTGPATVGSTPSRSPRGANRIRRPPFPSRIEPVHPGQVIATAGNAVVTVGRIGRLLGRSGWRIAKQIPGVAVVESGAQRAGVIAATEVNRLLQLPQHVVGRGSPSEEQRVMAMVGEAHADAAPLRSAMGELLERSDLADGERSREYLFGTIVSQLVPDEARMLATLARTRSFAVVDVLAREGGRSGKTRPVLTNASTLGAAAGVAVPHSTPTYLSRLLAFGLVELVPPPEELTAQYETLRSDQAVRAARAEADRGRQTSAKVVRKAVRLSPLGREFWAACAPPASGARRRSG